MNKPYFFFAGDTYYPRQGFGNLRGRFETFEEAKNAAMKNNADWKEIYLVSGDDIKLIYDC